jgi:hypothetical protein
LTTIRVNLVPGDTRWRAKGPQIHQIYRIMRQAWGFAPVSRRSFAANVSIRRINLNG